MNNKILSIIRNLSYTFISNFLSLFISTLVVLILPKIIGVEDYGYWQLYLFYISYVGFLHFGWSDGVYLRYGGKEYKDLNKSLLGSQFYMLCIMQLLIAIVLIIISYSSTGDSNKSFILRMIAVCIVIVNTRSILLFVLQGTNRIKEFAKVTILEQVSYFIILMLFLMVGMENFGILIAADLMGKLLSLVTAIYYCKDIVILRFSHLKVNFKEAIKNISVGIRVMFAYIASLLVVGVARFGIERTWDIVTFGKISLILSISRMLMVFINAIGIVLFPILKRVNQQNLSIIYVNIRDLLMILLLGILIIFYPLKEVLSTWLPSYKESFLYLSILFPMIVFEGKMALLINTYLKTLRKETLMLKINLLALLVSVILTSITTVILKNLDLTVLSILIVLCVRSIVSEIVIANILKINVYKDLFLELLLTTIFMLTGWLMNSWKIVLIYSVAYILYLFLKKEDIRNTIHSMKALKERE
ncbi:oligosaccharide flippase family protein [Priestia endophytica]|uniref:oligosaccharide flippase family protein n=1 Tax=Priestia endophytica TaxID=135735 RepID=UPI00124E2115|nr:oligosaccharide flippase family protein [Priestia endophytica]KAB2494536.1 oligosaccharide flippase family protein [Priestia endophytica]